jgi:hypothetical protein
LQHSDRVLPTAMVDCCILYFLIDDGLVNILHRLFSPRSASQHHRIYSPEKPVLAIYSHPREVREHIPVRLGLSLKPAWRIEPTSSSTHLPACSATKHAFTQLSYIYEWRHQHMSLSICMHHK